MNISPEEQRKGEIKYRDRVGVWTLIHNGDVTAELYKCSRCGHRHVEAETSSRIQVIVSPIWFEGHAS